MGEDVYGGSTPLPTHRSHPQQNCDPASILLYVRNYILLFLDIGKSDGWPIHRKYQWIIVGRICERVT